MMWTWVSSPIKHSTFLARILSIKLSQIVFDELSDLQALIYNAQLAAVHARLDKLTKVDNDNPTPITDVFKERVGNQTSAEQGTVLLTYQAILIDFPAPPSITMQDLLSALETTTPSVDEKERRKYEKMYRNPIFLFCSFFYGGRHADFIQSRGEVVAEGSRGGPRQTLA